MQPVELEEVKTDEDIYQAALEEWLGILGQLWTAYDKEIEPDRLEIYRKQFSILPMGLLDVAVTRAIREHTFNSVPTVGEVWQAVRKILGNPSDLDGAIEHWHESIPDGIYRLHEMAKA